MNSNYYYLYSSLPEIHFNEKTDYRNLEYLFDEIMESLADSDKSAMRYIRYPLDNINLVRLLEGKPDFENNFLSGGNYTFDELKREVKSMDTLPVYMRQFLELFNQLQVSFERANQFDQLNEFFYSEILSTEANSDEFQETLSSGESSHDFIKRWYTFERDFNNVLTAIECLQHNEPVERRETIRIDQRFGQRLSGDYEITESLRQSKSYDYSLSGIFPWMTKVLNLKFENIYEHEKQIVLIQMEVLDEMVGENIFSLDALCAYFIKLGILIRWSSLDETIGRNFVDNLSKTVMSSIYGNNR